jgi:hypothetical protein
VSAVSAMLRGRQAALALMVDTVSVTRINPATTTTNTDTGVVTPGYDVIYTGPCKVQRVPRASRTQPTSVAEAEVILSRLELHVPTSVVGIAADDLATITASPYDADLVGRTFHVRELAHKSFETARRYGVEEVAS